MAEVQRGDHKNGNSQSTLSFSVPALKCEKGRSGSKATNIGDSYSLNFMIYKRKNCGMQNCELVSDVSRNLFLIFRRLSYIYTDMASSKKKLNISVGIFLFLKSDFETYFTGLVIHIPSLTIPLWSSIRFH